VEDPASEVIDELGLCECLMTTFMTDVPKTGGDEANGKAVE